VLTTSRYTKYFVPPPHAPEDCFSESGGGWVLKKCLKVQALQGG
jgi:hypothetical protein